MADVKKYLLMCSSAALLAGCSVIPPQAYYNRGDPENLLDVSSEIVNVSLTPPDALSQLSGMIAQDPPSSAELRCQQDDPICLKAKGMFEHRGILTQWKDGGEGVTLVYQRVMARDCENRYIDNSINPYNLSPPTFGCSITGNMVQMVSDKRQFVNPNLLDFQDAEKPVEVYEQYQAPPPALTQQPTQQGAIPTLMPATQ